MSRAVAEPLDRPAGPARWRVVALAALVPFALLAGRFAWVCDDAWISFRFARNLARGDGLVFNPGQEAVEGYSNLLWVLLAALVERVGASPAAVLPVVSASCAALLVARLLRFLAVEAEVPTPGLWAAGLFLGTFPPLAVWATSGLAAGPVALATTVLFEALVRRRPSVGAAAVAAALLTLLRADGFVWVAVVAGAALAAGGVGGERPWRAAVAAVAATALVFAALVAWRLSYYGDWLPQTARAKGRLDGETLARGGRYVVSHALTFPSVVLALLALVWSGRRGWRGGGAALLAVLGNAGYAAVSGGDFMAMGRFLVPTAALVAVVVARGAGASWPRAAVLVAVLAPLSLMPAFDRHAVPERVRAAFHFRWSAKGFVSERAKLDSMREVATRHAEVGRALAALTPPDASIVLGAIGAAGYESDRTVWDQNGLVCRDVTRESQRLFRRSPGHDFFVPREFFRGRATYASVNVFDFGSGDFRLPVRWGDETPASHPQLFEQRMLVRSDADPRRVAQAAARFGWIVAPAEPEDALSPGCGLLLVRWRD